MFGKIKWLEKAKKRIKAIDWPAIALTALREARQRAQDDKTRKEERAKNLKDSKTVRKNDPESQAKAAHASETQKTLTGILIALGAVGILGQMAVFVLYVNVGPSAAAAAGAITDVGLVTLLGGALYVALSRLYSCQLGHSTALRIAAWLGVPVAAALAILLFSRMASPEQAASLLASGVLTASLLIVAEVTPAMIGALVCAIRFAGDPERRDAEGRRLAGFIDKLDEFIKWANDYEKELLSHLNGPGYEADDETRQSDRTADPQTNATEPKSPVFGKANGATTAATTLLVAATLLGFSVHANAQNAQLGSLKCSIALGGDGVVDNASKDEFLKHLIENSSVFSQCSQVRLTSYMDRGRFSGSTIHYPTPETPVPNCISPQPVSQENKLSEFLDKWLPSFHQASVAGDLKACNEAKKTAEDSNLRLKTEWQTKFQKALQPNDADKGARCVDTISALGFLAEEQPDLLIVGSDFSANCAVFSWLWQPIRLQLPRQSRIVFVVLPSRGDVRVEGEAAYARANLWRRYNETITIRVPSELTPVFFKRLFLP